MIKPAFSQLFLRTSSDKLVSYVIPDGTVIALRVSAGRFIDRQISYQLENGTIVVATILNTI